MIFWPTWVIWSLLVILFESPTVAKPHLGTIFGTLWGHFVGDLGPFWSSKGHFPRKNSRFFLGLLYGTAALLGANMSAFSAIFRPSWARLGVLWSCSCYLQGHLVHLLGRLGGILGQLVVVLGHLGAIWGHLERSLGQLGLSGAVLEHFFESSLVAKPH